MRTRWAAIGAAVAVSLGGGVVLVANAATSGTYNSNIQDGFTFNDVSMNVFQPITPCRLLDTRTGNVPGSSPAVRYQRGIRNAEIGSTSPVNESNNNIEVPFDPAAAGDEASFGTGAGQYYTPLMGDCDESIVNGHDPVAIVVNITIGSMNDAGFMTLYPWDDPEDKPYTSSITVYRTAPTEMNGVTIALAAATDAYNDAVEGMNSFRIYQEEDRGSVDVIIDVFGYYYSQQIVANVEGVDLPL